MPTSSPTDLGSASVTGTAGTTVITTSAGAALGALVIVMAQHESAGGVTLSGCADSRGNTYTEVAQQQIGGIHRCAMYYSVLATALQTSDTITVTNSSTAPNRMARAFYVTGAAASPFDKKVNASLGSGASQTTADSATLSQADELVVVMFGGGNNSTITPVTISSGYTQFADIAVTTAKCLASGWKIVSATTAVNATVTWHVSETSSGWILATFKAVVGNTYTKTGMGAIG